MRGANVVDGTGGEAFAADVLLVEGLVAAISRPGGLSAAAAEQTIDAAGLVLAPGFIDAHSHADAAPLLDEVDVSKISQGVTTEVVGNCGFSLAPCPPGRREEIAQMCSRLFPALPFDWATVPELFVRLQSAGHLVNVVHLVGHHTLRAAAMGLEDRAPTPAESQHMRAELAAALAAGAAGLSSGLIYPPGVYSVTDELVALAEELSGEQIYTTHLRDEGRGLLAAVDEAVEVAVRARCRLQVSHLKAAGQGAWGTVPLALERLDAADERGLDVHHDVYPYEANSTMLSSCLPPWFHDGGHAATLARLGDPAALHRAEQELHHDDGTWQNWVAGSGWPNVMVASAADPNDEGRTLDQVAQTRGTTPFRTLVDLLLDSDLGAWMCVFAMDPADVRAALVHPRAVIGSDGAPPGRGGTPHPRLNGTFTRVLGRHVRERGDLSLPEAVAKMTSRPAAVFGLAGRGVVAVGAAADVVLLDPATVADRATFNNPVQLSAGIEVVVVNGAVAYERGRATGPRAGRRLRPQPAQPTTAPTGWRRDR